MIRTHCKQVFHVKHLAPQRQSVLAPDDTRYTLDHFYAKLFRLPETLHTPEAKMLAQRRAEFMRIFLREFAGEINVPYPARDNR